MREDSGGAGVVWECDNRESSLSHATHRQGHYNHGAGFLLQLLLSGECCSVHEYVQEMLCC